MEKALSMGKSSATGSFHLLIGVIVSNVIMAVGTIILGRILSSSDYGLYGIAMIPAVTINLFRDLGVNSAITKYIASYRASNKESDIHGVILAGVIFEIASGAILTLLSFLISGFLAILLNRPESVVLIMMMSLSIFGSALFAAAQAIFVGFERMKLNSFTLVCQAVVKATVSPLLVIFGYGVLGATIGYIMGLTAAGIIGLALMYFSIFKKLNIVPNGGINLAQTLKLLLKYGIPLSVQSLAASVLPQVFIFLMALYSSNELMGNYAIANNFAVLLTFIVVPINTVLFPAFAKINPSNENMLLKTVFTSSIKYTCIILIPATMAVIVLSSPIVNTLFGEKYALAPFFLILLAMANLFAIFGNLSLGNLLSGMGETNQIMKQSLLSLAIGLLLAFTMVPPLGIVGGIAGLAITGVPSLIWCLYWARKKYNVKVDFVVSTKIFIASLLAALPTYLILNILSVADWIRLAFGSVLFLMLYLIVGPLIGAINQSDIGNLRIMFSNLGVATKLADFPLRLAELSLKLRYYQGNLENK